jgi:hypothetical protein
MNTPKKHRAFYDFSRSRQPGRRETDKEHRRRAEAYPHFVEALEEVMQLIDNMPQDSALCVPFLAWQFKHFKLLNKEES